LARACPVVVRDTLLTAEVPWAIKHSTGWRLQAVVTDCGPGGDTRFRM
jgi:hypothetical protein